MGHLQRIVTPRIETEFKRIEAAILDQGGKVKRAYIAQKEGYINTLCQQQQIPRHRAYTLWIKKQAIKWRLFDD